MVTVYYHPSYAAAAYAFPTPHEDCPDGALAGITDQHLREREELVFLAPGQGTAGGFRDRRWLRQATPNG
jgi:hypothetical protein